MREPEPMHRTASPTLDDMIRAAVLDEVGSLTTGYTPGPYSLVMEMPHRTDPDAPPLRVRFTAAGTSPHHVLGLLRAAVKRLDNELA